MDPDETIASQEMTLENAVSTLVKDLPKPVQDFVTGPERAAISLQLTQKYQLHADQAGAFERAFIFMLLGVSTPEKFAQDLEGEGIPRDTINALATDLNQLVFMKLRAEEEASITSPAPQTVPAPTIAPAPIMATPIAPITVPSPTPLPSAPQKIINRIPTPTAPQPIAIPSVPTVTPPMQAPAPQRSAPPSENKEALHDLLKSYGVDPYREPPE